MSVVRNRPKGARFASFGIGLCVFALMPNQIGYQDIASLLARQPGVAERWQRRVFSPAASIQPAHYSFGRPIGTSTPESASYRLPSLDNPGMDIIGSVTHNPLPKAPPRYLASDFPSVDRTLKGDRLVPPPGAQPDVTAPAENAPKLEDPASSNASVKGAKTAQLPFATSTPLDPELQAAMEEPPLPQDDISMSLEPRPLADLKTAPDAILLDPAPPRGGGFNVKTARLYFGSSSLGGSADRIQSWQPGEELLIVTPDALPDPDMKATASLPPVSSEAAKTSESGESVAPKGEVNADNQQPKTPAERLGLLEQKRRAKAEKLRH